MTQPYDKIERAYGPHLERGSDNLVAGADNETGNFGIPKENDGAGTTSPAGGGGTAEVIKNESQFSDLWIQNTIKSLNWKPKKQGFYMDGATGYAEFSDIFVAGGITASTGVIGGWNIETDQLSSGAVKLQSLAERILMGSATAPLTGTGIFLGKDGGAYKFRAGDPAGPYMLWDGTALSVRGANIVAPGIGSDIATMTWTFDAVFSKTGTTAEWTSGTLTFQNGLAYAIVAGATPTMTDGQKRYIYFDQNASPTVLQTSLTGTDAVGHSKILIAVSDKAVGEDPTYQVFGGGGGIGVNVSGSVPTSANGWLFNGTFTAVSNNQVDWGAGTLYLGDDLSTTYSISAGNTGALAAVSYIYFDSASPTILQVTTTASAAVGENKILIGVAQNVSSPKVATFQIFGGRGGISNLITADQIAADTITGDEIAANTITAGKMSVSSLSSITANIGSVTSGTITGALIRTSSSGSRVEIDGSSDDIQIFDSGNDLRMKLDSDELSFYNTSGTQLGRLNTPTTSDFKIESLTGNRMVISALGSSDFIIFNVGGNQIGYFASSQFALDQNLQMNNNDILSCGNIEANDTTSDIGSSTTNFDNLYIEDIYFKSRTGSPTTDGQMFYYVSGGTHEIRIQFNGFDFKLDAS